MSSGDTATGAAVGPRGLGVPDGWRVVEASGPGPFTTRAVVERPDGTTVVWTSRRHRKRLGTAVPGALRGRPVRRAVRAASPVSWWMGSLFAVGSLLFGVGSLPFYVDAVDAQLVALTFFVGSLFFTSAAAVQYHEAATSPDSIEPTARAGGRRRLVSWRPHTIAWWASGVQLAGTVAFNVSTFAAMASDLDLQQEKRLIWAPDLVGSVFFLISGWLAYAEVNDRVLPRSDGSVGWWCAAVNLAGCVAFGLAALGARYLTTTGEPANIALVNAGTFAGAVCFLVGAALLPVESSRDTA